MRLYLIRVEMVPFFMCQSSDRGGGDGNPDHGSTDGTARRDSLVGNGVVAKIGAKSCWTDMWTSESDQASEGMLSWMSCKMLCWYWPVVPFTLFKKTNPDVRPIVQTSYHS